MAISPSCRLPVSPKHLGAHLPLGDAGQFDLRLVDDVEVIERVYQPGASYNCWKIVYWGETHLDWYRLDLQTGEVLSYNKFDGFER